MPPGGLLASKDRLGLQLDTLPAEPAGRAEERHLVDTEEDTLCTTPSISVNDVFEHSFGHAT